MAVQRKGERLEEEKQALENDGHCSAMIGKGLPVAATADLVLVTNRKSL